MKKKTRKKKENKVFVLNVYCTLFACNLLPIIERIYRNEKSKNKYIYIYIHL